MSRSRSLLTDEQLSAGRPAGWSGDTASISREYPFDSYLAGLAFVVRVARAAEQVDHHPEMLLGYRRVKVTFSTHDAGGVTALDLAGAQAADDLYTAP